MLVLVLILLVLAWCCVPVVLHLNTSVHMDCHREYHRKLRRFCTSHFRSRKISVETPLDCGMYKVECTHLQYTSTDSLPPPAHSPPPPPPFHHLSADHSQSRPDSFGNFLRRQALAMATTFLYSLPVYNSIKLICWIGLVSSLTHTYTGNQQHERLACKA